MRIGELAALVGVSTRTVRHYHHLGLLPEPTRLANGYREYRLRDAVALARIRRLVELGLSLDEIRDVLADDRGRELREVLAELDADLARQQEVIAVRRARLAALLAEADLNPDATVSPAMAEVLRALPAAGSRFAEVDREMLSLMDSMAGPAEREEALRLLRPLLEPEVLARGHAIYERLDEIADADVGDPRVCELAADVVDHLPPEMVAAMLAHLPAPASEAEENARGEGARVSGPSGAERSAKRGAWLWVLRRRHGVPPGATAVPYARGQTPMLLVMLFVMVLETVAVEVLLRALGVPDALRITVLVIDVYGVMIGLAVLAACVTRPHVVTEGELRVRYGAFFDLRVPREIVSSARRARNLSESGMVSVRDGRLAVAIDSQTNVVVELTEPVTVVRPPGRPCRKAARAGSLRSFP